MRHQSYPRLSQVPPDPLDCRALRERQLSVRQPIWSNFRIRSYWTRIVLSKIIESARFFVQWREARSMLILEYELMRANGSNL